MRVYRATYKDRSGEQRKSAKWYLDFADHNQLRHKIPAFADKRLSEALGRNIEALINCRIAGLEPDVKLNQWIETLPEILLRKFVSWGLIDGQRTEITKPLTEHISHYVKVLAAKGYSGDYVVRTRNRLRKMVSDCRFHYFRDITRSAVEVYSGKLKKDGYGDTSRGHYLDALKTFLNWAEQDQRIVRNPIAKMDKPKRDSEKKGILTPEQFVHLIKTTSEKNILIGNSSGAERAVLYLLAGMTGLRRKELLHLTWDAIDLSADSASVKVKASIAKNGKEAEQPVPPATVAILQTLKAQTRPNDGDRVFALPQPIYQHGRAFESGPDGCGAAADR
jgi:integrase